MTSDVSVSKVRYDAKKYVKKTSIYIRAAQHGFKWEWSESCISFSLQCSLLACCQNIACSCLLMGLEPMDGTAGGIKPIMLGGQNDPKTTVC